MGNNGRDRWGARSVFLLAAIGSAVGLGNIWRYPHIAYSGGGGAFLVPYFIALLTAGIPLLMLEFGLGHKMQRAAPGAFREVHHRFEIPGWWAAFGGLFITFYYTIIMAWVCYYIFQLGEVVVTGADQLPWDRAGGAGNFLVHEAITGDPGVKQAEGNFSLINPWAVGFNALVWGFIYFAIRNGVKSVGKVVWVTVLMPYVLLFVLFFTAINLDGAAAGLNYYLSPDWTKYTDPETGAFSIGNTLDIASKAYGQIFFSLSIGFGVMIAYASFLPRRADVANNTLITAFANSATEFFGGIITFCVLGFLALQSGQFTGDVVGTSSFGLAFNSYPTAISNITGDVTSNALIGMAFFGCLLFLGIDSAFSLVEAIVAGIHDKFNVPRKAAAAGFCVLGWLVGVLYCTPAGLVLLDTADHYLSEYGLLLIGLFQCVAVGWVYGPKRMREHINSVSERRITPFWDICIKYITPAALLVILGNNFLSDLRFLWDDDAKMYSGYSITTQLFGISMVIISLGLGVVLATRKPTRIHEDAAPRSPVAGGGKLLSWLLVGALLAFAVGAADGALASEKADVPAASGTPAPAERARLLTMPALLEEGTRNLMLAAPPAQPGQTPSAEREAAIRDASAMFAEAAVRARKEQADRKAAAEWATDREWVGEWAARLSELHGAFERYAAVPPDLSQLEADAGRLGASMPGKPSQPPVPEEYASHAAILLQAEIDILLGISGPLLPLIPEDNAVFRLIEPYVMFRDPQDLGMISPFQPVGEANRAALLESIRKFALRYPSVAGDKPGVRNGLRVAAAWAKRDAPKGVIAMLGGHPKGLPERTISNMVVEDMLAVWKGRVPAASHWRKRHVLMYSNETNLTSPDNGALIMLLLGSAVLFGGLAWSLYVARRGKPDSDADPDSATL